MSRERIIKEQVSYLEEKPLQPGEIQLLKDKAYRQIILYLPGYLLLLTGAIVIFINAPGSFKAVVNPSADIDEEEASRMWKLAPYFSAFVVIMATIFFGKIFYQTILPLLKDLKHKNKILVFYKPEKIAMTVFNRYYLSVPLFIKRQVQTDVNDFNMISETDELCVELSKNSLVVLGIKNNERDIRYHELINRS